MDAQPLSESDTQRPSVIDVPSADAGEEALRPEGADPTGRPEPLVQPTANNAATTALIQRRLTSSRRCLLSFGSGSGSRIGRLPF
jgi:hypothetical protein